MRKLATIRKIKEIKSIANADSIEVATIDGWKAVVKKGEFKKGDLVIYCEIDSIMPELPVYSFLANKKYRIKTIKLRGQISQGLVIPLYKSANNHYSVLTKYLLKDDKIHKYIVELGDDVTDFLGIKKFIPISEREEKPRIEKYGFFEKKLIRYKVYRYFKNKYSAKSKGYPKFISKTDEERIQNIPEVLKEYANESFYYTEKIDGQSGTFWYNKNLFSREFGVASRTMRKGLNDNNNWANVAKRLQIEKKLKKYGKSIAIQGEVVGGKIQGNKYKFQELDLFVFNVFDIKEKRYYSIDKIIEFCKQMDLKHVPLIDNNFKLLKTVDEMIELSKEKSLVNTKMQREGIVLRSKNPKHFISFKVINPMFLLKNEVK